MSDQNQKSIQMPLDVERIQKMLPHRYPFLLVDRVIEFTPPKHLVALKNVSINEPFFQGHFPSHPVMPGVLIIEAMAQAAGLLTQLLQASGAPSASLFYLVKVDNARFSRIVVPGDQLRLEVEQKRVIKRMGFFDARALVDGEVVASAELLCAERAS
jgi:3-hydroxyacyl-[acyl-carrier-protein] dehydratase